MGEQRQGADRARGHPRPRALRSVGPIWILLTFGVMLTGCPSQVQTPNVTYELTDTGIVESVEEVDPCGLGVALARGESIEIPCGAVSIAGGELILPGDLLLVAKAETSNGYVPLSIVHDDGCWILQESAVDDGSHIWFEFGLRLPKAPLFDPGGITDGRFPSFPDGFCINAAGEVIRYGS